VVKPGEDDAQNDEKAPQENEEIDTTTPETTEAATT
jgi:hypothetical protein